VAPESQPRQKTSRPLLIAALVLSLSITAGSLIFAFYRLNNAPANNTGAAIVDSASYYDGATVYDPPRPLDDFTLTGNDGEPLGLSDLLGKVTLVYFGYTNCPDMCPLTLANFKRIKADLGDDAAQVNFLMISVDGTRDTPVHMYSFMSAFDPDFLGMTGSAEDIGQIAGTFDLDYVLHTDGGENYSVDHTASIFMVDQAGVLRTLFPYGTEPVVIVEAVRELL
jgi:protein SCO1